MEFEHNTWEDCEAGAIVLLDCILQSADVGGYSLYLLAARRVTVRMPSLLAIALILSITAPISSSPTGIYG